MTAHPDAKIDLLRVQGALHPRPVAVRDPLFEAHAFFDRRDLVQVKYEMLRRVSVDGEPVGATAETFGLSRPTFYQAQAAFTARGLPGLVPHKRGPRRAHKLGEEVMAFVGRLRTDEHLGARALARRIHDRFGVAVHPRSIERALRRPKKKPR